MPFDHVHDVSVSLKNIVQLAVRLSPDEDDLPGSQLLRVRRCVSEVEMPARSSCICTLDLCTEIISPDVVLVSI